MTASTDELIVGFPQSNLTKIPGEPTFEELKILRRHLNTNAMSVPSYSGGGRHGHLKLVINDAEYLAIAAAQFPAPANPGPTATIPLVATAAVITEANRAHKEATRVYRTYHNIDQSLKKLITEAVEDQYLNAISNKIVWHANQTSLSLLMQ